MARTPKPYVITSLPEGETIDLRSRSNPSSHPEAPVDPAWVRGLDRVLSVQRPLVLAHIRGIRRRNPRATPDQLIRILERRYLAAVTSGGAAVGATAMVPVIGTGVTIALSGAETAGFLEVTALFAQSVAEVHGIAVTDPLRARALVMTMILGRAGTDLLKNFTGEVTGQGPARRNHWGQMITGSMPQMVMGPVADQLKHRFVKHFAVNQGSTLIGKVMPFGIGAAIGGVGNHLAGRTVVASSRGAFGPAAATLSPELEPRERTPGGRNPLAGLRERVPLIRGVRRREPGSPEAPGSGRLDYPSEENNRA
ncbi:hypothetical protein [Mycetocola spongiae]|uniref:hypothetical protein n=1 Tax=Mycetocola spongiae TaxID=2859226 RepID=UPI001CF5D20F|nr:hypothetical protein [Mycetocola spongiae]UCR89085.1 hypothetical protein KXZ72_14295 [Mycetocola spongiae]